MEFSKGGDAQTVQEVTCITYIHDVGCTIFRQVGYKYWSMEENSYPRSAVEVQLPESCFSDLLDEVIQQGKFVLAGTRIDRLKRKLRRNYF